MSRDRTRSRAAVVAAVLMAVLSLAPAGAPAGAEGGARASWTVDEFVEATPPVSVLFEENATNSTHHLAVPRSGTVVDAQLVLEGEARYSLKGTPTDFSDNPGAGHQAFYGPDGRYPPVGGPGNYKWMQFMEPDEEDIAALDDSFRPTYTDWNNVPPPQQHPYQLYDLLVDRTDMARLRVEWHGLGQNLENKTYRHGASLWVLNDAASRWDRVAAYVDNEVSDWLYKLQATLKEPYDYTTSGGHVYVLAFGQPDERTAMGVSVGSLATDYVAATVLRNDTLVLPRDAALAVDNGTAVWSRAGELSGQVTVGAAQGLVTALQSWIDAAGVGPGQLTVPITFRVGAPTYAAVRVRSLSVQVREPDNRAPEFVRAAEVQMTEDVNLPQALDMWEHFEDDLQGDDLLYAVEHESNASAVHATVSGDERHIDLEAVAPDWAGCVTFRFSATDAWGLKTVSADFSVTVLQVNDPPSADAPPTQYLQEDVPFEFELAVREPDTPYGDVLAFTDDTALFDVDQRGRIAFTPAQEDVGRHDVGVTVTDGSLASVRVPITLIVAESNDAPVILDPGVLRVEEGGYLSCNFTLVDPDGSDTGTWTLVGKKGTMFLGRYNGRLTWIPTDEEVGWHNVSVIVSDREGASFQLNVTIQVINLNDPPSIERPPTARMTEGELFTSTLALDDPDLGFDPDERLTVSVDPPLFEVAPDGNVSFTPSNDHVGTHRLNVTVTDAAGASASTWWDIAVDNINQPPVVEPVAEQTWREDEPVSMRIMATDPDLGDTLEFIDSTSIFIIDRSTGVIAFVPRQQEAGEHTITIRVTDGEEEVSVTFRAVIQAVNDPPVVAIRAEWANTTIEEGASLSAASIVSDEDDEREELTFSWALDGKEIGKADNVVVRDVRPGSHVLALTVSDGTNQTSTALEFEVEEAEGGSPVVAMGAGLVAAVVAIVVLLVLWTRLKGGRGGEGKGGKGKGGKGKGGKAKANGGDQAPVPIEVGGSPPMVPPSY